MDSPLQTILVELRGQLRTIYGDRLARVVLFGSHARARIR